MRQLSFVCTMTITTDDRNATAAELAEAFGEHFAAERFDSLNGEACVVDSVDIANEPITP